MVVFAKWRLTSLYGRMFVIIPFLGLFWLRFSSFVWGMEFVCDIAIVVGCSCLPSSAIEVAFEADSPSACFGQYAHATILHVEKCIVCWFTIACDGTCHGNVLCIGCGFYKWLCHTMLLPCSCVFLNYYFLKPLFFRCKGSVMLRQMESVLCGRFAVTNKIADNLPFSPHRQQKTSIIVDFHGAILMCHIPALDCM